MNKIHAFLARIGLENLKIEHTFECLDKIQEACVLHIPYENLDILAGRPLALDVESVYTKVVENHRGGYCFETNALLHYMLAEMGFTVRSCFARVLRGEAEIPFRRHRILLVTIDGMDCMADIGFGNIAPRRPLKLICGEVQEQNGETYRFEQDPELGWVIWELHKGEWRQFISFTAEHQYETDFVPTSFWCEKHPDSPFNKAEMVAIKIPGGRKTVDGHTHKIFTGTEITYLEENMSDERLAEVLRTEFGLAGY
ncbi:MAG: arylamine N-acetyltransferase [Clostridia bacterium]|nr:arylamine N-acetyltransferase [Clostridia bacterium]